MPDESIRDLIRRVRRTLQERGAAGAFLLQELDIAISSGNRVRTQVNPRNDASPESEGLGLTDDELLRVLHSVFETYLVTLPSITRNFSERLLGRFGIQRCEIALDRSLLEEDEVAAGRVKLQAVVPPEPNQSVKAALSRLGEIVHERTR